MITVDDVRAAADRLDGVAHRTPVVTSRTLDGLVGARVFLKAENLQRVGAFKFRGAYNALAGLPDDQRRAGVFAFSSGNHAQAVALSAHLLGVPATILMPEDAPPLKLAATRGYGAEVVRYDRYEVDREELGRTIASERGLTLVPPYDHPAVIAGQGTATLELLDHATAAAGGLDTVVTPVGGGGLLAGATVVAAALAPDAEVVGVEPEVRTVARDAIATGAPVTAPIPRTIADGQQTPAIGRLPLEVFLRAGTRVVGVPDDAIVRTMRWLFERTKLVVEPSGAAGLAAIMDGRIEVAGRRVGVVLSGGNVDAGAFARLVTDATRG
ncbi:MAG: pyridoxal-phosphate dependent enzyme [Actinobacteria bacterium]|nr:pyridoxal-phosphate dependent enzyme [Actinomycetota bacterium]